MIYDTKPSDIQSASVSPASSEFLSKTDPESRKSIGKIPRQKRREKQPKENKKACERSGGSVLFRIIPGMLEVLLVSIPLSIGLRASRSVLLYWFGMEAYYLYLACFRS